MPNGSAGIAMLRSRRCYVRLISSGLFILDFSLLLFVLLLTPTTVAGVLSVLRRL